MTSGEVSYGVVGALVFDFFLAVSIYGSTGFPDWILLWFSKIFSGNGISFSSSFIDSYFSFS